MFYLPDFELVCSLLESEGEALRVDGQVTTDMQGLLNVAANIQHIAIDCSHLSRKMTGHYMKS